MAMQSQTMTRHRERFCIKLPTNQPNDLIMICWGLEKSDRSSMATNNKWAGDDVEDEESPVLTDESLVASKATWKTSGKVRR